MEQINKNKVAMICYFSNPQVRAKLPLYDRKLYNFLRKIMHMPTKSSKYGDIAPWTTSTISNLSSRSDIELCIVAAHSGLKKRHVSFEENNVHYHFVACDYGNFLGKVINNPQTWIKYNPVGKRINRIINDFLPDIVVLIGAENGFYAHAVLSIKVFPVLVLCQTIYNNPERAQYSAMNPKSAAIERMIFQKELYFGVYSRMHFDLLQQFAPHALIFKYGYPTKGLLMNPTPTDKEYDFVNFALTLDLRKGAQDSIKALSIVKQKYPNVKLNLVGGCNSDNRKELNDLIHSLDLKNNVIFTPFFEKQSDLFHHIQKSRFAVLPCKLDNISGTMTQSMQLGLPLVVYKTSGTPLLNREKECALIAGKGNIEELAQHMLTLMDCPEKAEMLAQNAREFQVKQAEYNRGNGDRLVANMRAVIENYRKGVPIPQEQLFDPNCGD